MKKLYNKQIIGYYVMSVVLGLLLALSIATVLEVAVLDGIPQSDGALTDALDAAWGYLPLNLCNFFWTEENDLRNLYILMVTVSVLTVGIFVRMAGGKNSRTKVLQALSTAFFALLVMLAYGYATRGWIANRALAVVPVLLLVIPLTILKTTQQPHDDISWAGLKLWRTEMWRQISIFARHHPYPTFCIFLVAFLLGGNIVINPEFHRTVGGTVVAIVISIIATVLTACFIVKLSNWFDKKWPDEEYNEGTDKE